MAYRILGFSSPEDFYTRVGNIEAILLASEGVGLIGVHSYAGSFVPATLTTGTDTAGVANQLFVSEIRIGGNALITGISFLLGSVGGTDKVIVSLYDSAGNLLANSAVAGTTAGTLATFQRIAFTTAYQAAPGLYYVAVQFNGTTAKLRTQAAGDHNCGLVTGQTFGTPASLTPPTTFTAAAGPIAMLY